MKVIYPVLFYEEEDGKYSVFVPDLAKALNSSASTYGDNLEEAMDMAQKWVNTKAEDLHINFSKPLEEALLEKIYKNYK